MGNRIDQDCLLQQPVEKLSPTDRGPSVKPKNEFIKIMVQIPMSYTALMDPKQPPFEQGCDPVNAGKIHQRGCASFAIQDRGIMLVTQSLQTSISLPSIGDDHTTPSDMRAHESSKNPSFGIGDSLKSYSTNLLATFFRCDTDENLMSLSADFSFVNLHPSGELFSAWPDHSPAQLVEHGPRGFVASQAQGSLKSERTDPALLIGDPPDRSEPEAQADLAPFKDCAHCNPDVPMAASTSQQTACGFPDLLMVTSRAVDAFGPAEAEQIFAASMFRSESVFEFEQSRGIS